MLDPFGVRPVRAKQDALHRNVLCELADAVLDKRSHPAMLVKLIHRVLGKHAWVLYVQHLQSMQQRTHPS